jgi:hypothetical protein
MLLLAGPLFAELTHHFLPKARGFGEHVVQAIEHLFQGFSANRGPVGHSFRKDYGNLSVPVKLNCDHTP